MKNQKHILMFNSSLARNIKSSNQIFVLVFLFFQLILVVSGYSQAQLPADLSIGNKSVWTYNLPNAPEYQSSDYEVSIIQGTDTLKSFVYYSYGLGQYTLYSQKGVADPTPKIMTQNSPKRNSSTIFSFTGTVTVRIKVNSSASDISFPLKSAKVLPLSYNIPCTIKDGNIIEFQLDRPEKIAVIPNYDAAMQVYNDKGVGHIPISSWKNSYAVEKARPSFHGTNLEDYVYQGYQNPLFVFAHEPEKSIPDSTASTTLVVHLGDLVTQTKLNQYKTIWFTPGVHDLSQLGSTPFNYTQILKGQTFYLEGGSYVKARINGALTGDGKSKITGRGIISGINHKWVKTLPLASQIISVDSVMGITITDRACFGLYRGSYIGDIAMIGAWHANSDCTDVNDNCLIENCFFQAHDDNLKINHNTHARHCVIWQGENAHPVMVKETFRDVQDGIHLFANSIVEDIDIIGYFVGSDWDNPWPHISRAAIAVVTAMDIQIKNFTFRDIRIEAPFLYRIFDVYNLDSTVPSVNPGWFQTTSESYHTKIDSMAFSNIKVTCPVICYNSLIGSGYSNSLKNLSLSNININGTDVTSKNCSDFIEIESANVDNLTLNNELIQGGLNALPILSDTKLLNIYYTANQSIRVSSKTDLNRIDVYDLLGSKILNVKCSGNEASIDTRGFSSGLYIFKIYPNAGLSSLVKLFIK
ncbi:MAG: T9SS type A sorting domain-containing protein [Bacteroidales bacterium]